MAMMQADLLLKVIGGTSFAFQTLFGLAVAIVASATLLSGEYPRGVCWAGVVGGVIWMMAGILLFSRVPGTGSWIIWLAVLPVALWMFVVGWLAWRRGNELAPSGVASMPRQ
jgi:hypothetical protein